VTAPPRLTKRQAEIMNVLWAKGACSIREIQENLPRGRRVAYTTVQTMVYRLEIKNAVQRKKKISNAHIFEATVARRAVLGHRIRAERWTGSTILFVSDAGAATAFYADKLGFTVQWRHDEDGHTLAAGINRDDCSILLNTQRPDRAGNGAIYFALGKAGHDTIRADLLAKGVALKDGWWDERLTIVEDPDGNQIWFADPRDRG
jgi:catechol 2,3-dioxygenase-like lactoylglutathione lyase family enzyme